MNSKFVDYELYSEIKGLKGKIVELESLLTYIHDYGYDDTVDMEKAIEEVIPTLKGDIQ